MRNYIQITHIIIGKFKKSVNLYAAIGIYVPLTIYRYILKNVAKTE